MRESSGILENDRGKGGRGESSRILAGKNIFLEGNDKRGLYSYSLVQIIKSLSVKFPRIRAIR